MTNEESHRLSRLEREHEAIAALNKIAAALSRILDLLEKLSKEEKCSGKKNHQPAPCSPRG